MMKLDKTRRRLILVHVDSVGMTGHIVDLTKGIIPDAGQFVFLPLDIVKLAPNQ